MRRPRTLGHLAGPALRFQPDSRLVALSRSGEERAFEEIVRRYRSGLVAYAATVVPGHRAEDVVQASLIKAHGAIPDADAGTRLRPWLYTIVRNTALNDLRDEPQHEQLDERLDGVPQPPEVAERRRQLDQLVAGLGSLPRAQREAIVKHELEGESHEEIAAALGSTRAAVRGLIYRARQALRDGVGMLIPASALRYLLAEGPLAGAGGATIGVAAGGGAGIATKTGVATVVAALAIGGGIALNRNREGDSGATASAGPAEHSPGGGGAPAGAGPATGGSDRTASLRRAGGGDEGPTGKHGEGGSGGDDGNTGSGDGGGGGHEGPGGGGEIENVEQPAEGGPGPSGGGGADDGDIEGIEAGDHEGPGGGGELEEDHSGPGGGEEELEPVDEPPPPVEG
jgi:RNA polymerase sigma-70 factor, ECF subfamily